MEITILRFVNYKLSLLLVATLFLVHCSEQTKSLEENAFNEVNKGSYSFTINLYKALSKFGKKNVLVSPLSLQLVLALSYTGARGRTANEISKLLSLPNNTGHTYAGYNSLVRALESPILKLANKIFVDASLTLNEGFQTNAEKYFLSSAKSINFQTDPEVSRLKINDWAENQTNKKIAGLLAPGKITGDTKIVMINAIHFKATWHQKFSQESTDERSFFISNNESVSVRMMHTKGEFGLIYSDELKASILKLDYEAKDFHMLVILPDDNDGLAALESALGSVNILNIVKDLDSSTVIVSLPKFKMEETVELNSILRSLGVETMFSSQADFSGMTDKPVAVSSVVQKSFIEVNENGTEAAAATAVVSVLKSLPMLPEFTADHPFIFLIMHKNFPMFIGRFTHPEEELETSE